MFLFSSHHGSVFRCFSDSLYFWGFTWNNYLTSATKHHKVRGFMRGKERKLFYLSKKVHNNVAREPLPRDSLLPFKYMYRLLHSYSCAIFNLHKLISYHINRKDIHIMTSNTVNIFQLSTFLSLLHRLGIQTTVLR